MPWYFHQVTGRQLPNHTSSSSSPSWRMRAHCLLSSSALCFTLSSVRSLLNAPVSSVRRGRALTSS